MATISLCMIVKNEEAVLARCLASVAPAVDEIIIVDTGSTDRTRAIAEQFTDRVYDFAWIDDFSAARNFSFSKATGDYCMWLDADDVLSESARNALLSLKKELDCDVVMMPYQSGSVTFYRERILRRDAGFRWEGAVHEAITPRGDIRCYEIPVTHQKERSADPNRNLRIYEKLLAEGHSFSARDRFYYARELLYHHRFDEAAAHFEALLQAGEGWLENRLESCRLLACCYRELGFPRRAFAALLHSFTLELPRPELCCDLGDLFLQEQAFDRAAYWYQAAMNCPNHAQNGGFYEEDRRGLYPALQLCVCCWRQGDAAQAERWNETAATFDPAHPAVLSNRLFFEQNKRPQ